MENLFFAPYTNFTLSLHSIQFNFTLAYYDDIIGLLRHDFLYDICLTTEILSIDFLFFTEETMDFFDVLTLIGGLALFLFGMQILGDGLSKVSGGRMESIFEKMTSNPIKGILLYSGVNIVAFLFYQNYNCLSII